MAHGGSIWSSADGSHDVRAGVLATAAGDVSPDPRDSPNLTLYTGELSYDQAEAMARAILAFVASEREAGR